MFRLVYDDPLPTVETPDVKVAMAALDKCYETGTGAVLYGGRDLRPIAAAPKVVKVGGK